MLRTLLSLALVVLCASAPRFSLGQDETDPLLGTFSGDDLMISIGGNGSPYTGAITLGGQQFPFTATKKGRHQFDGSFTAEGERYPFSGELRGNELLVRSGESSYTLRKAPNKRNPLERTAEKRISGESKERGASADAWKLFKHPTGLSLRHPVDWSIQEAPDGSGYLLLPPGVSPGAEELYLVGGQPAGEIASADDPRLAEAANLLMAQVAPLLNRKGAAEKVRAAETPGISLQWESAEGARARMFVTILNGQAIGITGIGIKEKIAKREETLRQIFQTLSAGGASLDRSLAGVWTRTGTTSIDARDNAGRLQASSAGDQNHTVQLRLDGSCTSREVSRTIAVGQGVAIDTGDQVTTKNGRWNASDGRLVLTWDGEAPQEFSYRVSGPPGQRQIIIKMDASSAQVWSEQR